MKDMIDFLTSKEIIVVYIIVAVAFFLCLVIFIIEKQKDKRRKRNNTRKLNKLVEDVNLRLQEGIDEPKKKKVKEPVLEVSNTSFNNVNSDYVTEDVDFIPPVVSNASRDIPIVSEAPKVPKKNYGDTRKSISELYESKSILNNANNFDDIPSKNESYNSHNVVEEKPIIKESVPSNQNDFNNYMDNQINKVNNKIDELIYTSAEPDREEATRELLKLTEEIEKAERAQRQGLNIDEYEHAQEEEAIISLEELTKRSGEMYAANELTQYADEGDEPISLADLEKRKIEVTSTGYVDNTPKVQEVVKQEEAPVYNERQIGAQINNNFNNQNSGSHAYQQRVTSSNDKIFSSVFGMNTPSSRTREEIDEELQKTSEFLLSLKDLQNRLNS